VTAADPTDAGRHEPDSTADQAADAGHPAPGGDHTTTAADLAAAHGDAARTAPGGDHTTTAADLAVASGDAARITAGGSAPTRDVRTAVLVTATENEPRRYGKPVVLGGILDHLCDRLGRHNVHLVLIGRTDVDRPDVPYHRHVLPKPGARQQATAVLRRVVLPPRRPLQEAALHSAQVRDGLRRILEEIDADLEIWDTVRTGQYAPDIPRAEGQTRVLYVDDLFSERYAAMLRDLDGDSDANPGGEFQKLLPGPARKLLASPRVYRPLLRLERTLVARSEERQPHWFDRSLLISAEETELLRSRCDAPGIDTLPPLLREPKTLDRTPVARPRFTFLGGFDYAPNIHGLDWFLTHCRDEVLATVPDIEIDVVGTGTDRGLDSAAAWGGRVRFHGWVDDLDAVLAAGAALLSPLRTGSGVKIKVLEALARGLPVVATPAGVQGIDAGEHTGCLVAADPAGLAKCLATAADPAVNARLSAAARAAWDERYGSAVVRRRYDELFNLLPGR
jgi:glycosyltransferase involved in cell wall biosynthesis